MKKFFITIIILVLLQSLNGQRINYYFFNQRQLQENIEIGWVRECNIISLDFGRKYFCYGIKKYSGHDVEITSCIIYSKFIEKNNEILLKDKITNNKIIFSMNDSSITFKNNSKYFKKVTRFM